MPRDEVVPRAQFNATRSITIDAPPEHVWPWIAQLGYRRGGFYTYDQVDSAGEPSADRILREYQDLKVGDLIPMWHESHGLAIAYKVDSFQIPKWMLWVHRPHENEEPDSTWSWLLDETADRSYAARYSHEAGLSMGVSAVSVVQPDPDGVRRLRDGTADAEEDQGESSATEAERFGRCSGVTSIRPGRGLFPLKGNRTRLLTRLKQRTSRSLPAQRSRRSCWSSATSR